MGSQIITNKTIEVYFWHCFLGQFRLGAPLWQMVTYQKQSSLYYMCRRRQSFIPSRQCTDQTGYQVSYLYSYVNVDGNVHNSSSIYLKKKQNVTFDLKPVEPWKGVFLLLWNSSLCINLERGEFAKRPSVQWLLIEKDAVETLCGCCRDLGALICPNDFQCQFKISSICKHKPTQTPLDPPNI